MPSIDVYSLITQIIDHNNSTRFTTPRSMIKYLLPIEKAYGYYMGNKAEFYDPQEDQIFYRNFDATDEKSRLDSLSYINGRIDYYNRHCEEQLKKGLLTEDQYTPIPHVIEYALKLRLAHPIIDKTYNDMTKNNISLVRVINEPAIYQTALKLDNLFFVPRFNKMIYDYLKSLIKDKVLVPQNTLYNPMLEFEDWFMSSGVDIESTPSLIKGAKGVRNIGTPVTLEVDDITTSIHLKPTVRANPEDSKWYRSPIEAKIINLIENERLEEFLVDCRFKHVNKINFKLLSKKLKCSDKTAKKLIQLHAPYVLE